MIGELKKVDERWYVSRCVGDGVKEVWEELTLLYPKDADTLEDYMDGVEVEFEFVNEFANYELYKDVPLFEGMEYAKIK